MRFNWFNSQISLVSHSIKHETLQISHDFGLMVIVNNLVRLCGMFCFDQSNDNIKYDLHLRKILVITQIKSVYIYKVLMYLKRMRLS